MELTKPTKRQRHALAPLTRPPAPYRCTRPDPDWGNRIGWTAIIISGAYLIARIVPALLFN